jgi:hypothetical protein
MDRFMIQRISSSTTMLIAPSKTHVIAKAEIAPVTLRAMASALVTP